MNETEFINLNMAWQATEMDARENDKKRKNKLTVLQTDNC